MRKTKNQKKHSNRLDPCCSWLMVTFVLCTVILAAIIYDAKHDILNRLDEFESLIRTDQAEEIFIEGARSGLGVVATKVDYIDRTMAITELAATEDFSYLKDGVAMSREHQILLHNACDEFDIPFELALAVCWRETGYRNISVNDEYFGYMMLAKKWVWPEMERLGVTDLMDPESGFRIGCCILRQHIDSQGGLEAALCRYSNDYSGKYASDVLEYMNELM